MKKAEEYLKSLYFKNGIKEQDYKFWYDANKQLLDQMVTAIKQVQIDAIDAAVKLCAEEAEAIEGWNTGYSGNAASVDKQSILQVAKELKKEFEDTNEEDFKPDPFTIYKEHKEDNV